MSTMKNIPASRVLVEPLVKEELLGARNSVLTVAEIAQFCHLDATDSGMLTVIGMCVKKLGWVKFRKKRDDGPGRCWAYASPDMFPGAP